MIPALVYVFLNWLLFTYTSNCLSSLTDILTLSTFEISISVVVLSVSSAANPVDVTTGAAAGAATGAAAAAACRTGAAVTAPVAASAVVLFSPVLFDPVSALPASTVAPV